MIKVPDIVKDILVKDDVALEAFRIGILNVSAYADKIQQEVEKRTLKPVRKGTIGVALSRLQEDVKDTSPLVQSISINDLSFRSSLSILTYEKTADIQRKIAVLNPFVLPLNDLFAVIDGQTEITIICSTKTQSVISKHLKEKEIVSKNNLVAITAQLSKELKQKPNILYTLLRPLAAKRISIIEIVSTSQEVSFIVEKNDMEEAVKALNSFFTKS